MIHELDSIPSNKQRGAPKSYIKWKAFIGRRGKESNYLIFLWRWKVGYLAVYLIGADQKIPDSPVKIIFLGDIVTAIRLGIKS